MNRPGVVNSTRVVLVLKRGYLKALCSKATTTKSRHREGTGPLADEILGVKKFLSMPGRSYP